MEQTRWPQATVLLLNSAFRLIAKSRKNYRTRGKDGEPARTFFLESTGGSAGL